LDADLTRRADRQAVLAEASRGQGVNVLLNAAGSNSFALLDALDDDVIDNLLATFPAVFEHPAFQQKKSAIERAFNQRYDQALDVVEKLALEKE
ncbi:hypothetical protein, partial [Pseudomonas sp. DE0010]|uniref:hypothetical protein n=1 Tax=Pseudomonas sp. DE0010 TaxID=2584951 RepID=UPI0021155332